MATTPSLSPSPSMGVGPPPGTIKLEDLHLPLFEEPSQTPEPTQTPEEADKVPTSPKPGKKRKSWGQKLPEPKTNLPPRKRAKTQDEKEQRRIERIKRNRLAAHNSRERKRVEVEELQQKNDALEEQVRSMQETMARMTEELAGLRSRVLRSPSAHPKVEPPSSLANLGRKPPTIGPYQAMSPPESTLGSFDIPSEASTQPSTPFVNNLIDVASTEPVQTQHSAAMLWDLQCQSGSGRRQTWNQHQLQWLIAYLIAFNLQLLIKSVSSISSTFLPTIRSNSLTAMTPHRGTPSLRTVSATMTCSSTRLRILSTCRPSLAQRLSQLLATSMAMRLITSSRMLEHFHGAGASSRFGTRTTGTQSRRLQAKSLLPRRRSRRPGGSLTEEYKRLVTAFDYPIRSSLTRRE